MKYTLLLLLALLVACDRPITPGAWATAVKKCAANDGVQPVLVGPLLTNSIREFAVTCKNGAMFTFRHRVLQDRP